MPHPLQKFRSFEIAEDSRGAALELWRSEREIVCLASDPVRQEFLELHVLAGVDIQSVSGEAAARAFRDQAAALVGIDHPNVIRVNDTGEDDGALFYLTELIDGESLDGFLARCNPLPAWLAADVATQLTRGLLAVCDHPPLLAGAEVFNARLRLDGAMTSDLRVKLADFRLGDEVPEPPSRIEQECHAAREVGRLLLYALSGMVSDKVSTRTLAALPVPVELAQLLGKLLDTGSPRPTIDLAGLLAALGGCCQSPSLATRPARVPPTLRPRLLLQSQFPGLDELAVQLGRGYRLERTGFDAAQPYAQRAFAEDTRPVTVQLLPPPRLMAPTFLSRLRQVKERATAARTPHLLRVLEIAPDTAWFIEEGAPRLHLDAALRIRRGLAPGEAAVAMREVDRAVRSAEEAGFPPTEFLPEQMFIEFVTKSGAPATPAEDELSTQTLDRWPRFRIRLRGHPVTARFAGPWRFQPEWLAERGLASMRPDDREVDARDYATLFVWMCGGLDRIPVAAGAAVAEALDSAGGSDRGRLLERLLDLIPKADTPARRDTKPAKPPRPPKGHRRSAPRTPARLHAPEPPADPAPPQFAAEEEAPEPFDFSVFGGADSEPAAAEDEPGGFAEILIERPLRGSRRAESGGGGLPAHEQEPDAAEMPVGALFGSEWATNGAEIEEEEDADGAITLRFQPREAGVPGPGLGRLVLLVVLCALVIAIIMAHFSGLAPWR